MNVHDFCRILLREARAEAKEHKVKLPSRITAIRSTHNLFFVEADGVKGEYVKGDCAFDAKASYIARLVQQ